MNINQITEARMSPAWLMRQAKTVEAIVGIEYEMLYPGSDYDADDYELDTEPDYSEDFEPDSIQEIVSFYDEAMVHGNANYSSLAVEQLESNLNDDYATWTRDNIDEIWKEHFDTYIPELIIKRFSRKLNRNQTDAFDTERKTAIRQLIDTVVADPDHKLHLIAKRFFGKQLLDPGELREGYEAEWIHENWNKASEVGDEYDMDWPYWSEPDYDQPAQINMQHIADSIGDAINTEVRADSQYHGQRRHRVGDEHYILETDSSVQDGDKSTGIELISYPMDFDQAQTDFERIKSWAEMSNVYTNATCGLHVNVSLADRSMDDFDALKAAVFLGDAHVLEQFNRRYNQYAESAFDIINQSVELLTPGKLHQLLDKIRTDMKDFVKSFRQRIRGGKYVSIHVQRNHVEFRSMGSDWLNMDTDQIMNTIARYIAVMDIATDPEKYKKEYMKRVYQMLQNSMDLFTGETDRLKLFVSYSLGVVDQQQLIRALKDRKTNQ